MSSAGWLAWPQTRAVFAALSAEGAMVRAVGGAVRDTLLDRPVGEVDLATDAAPETVMDLAAKAGLKAVPTGLDHGTVTLIAEGRPFEVTTLRADVETDGRHARVEFTADWEGDARRRDFTVNALYADSAGTLFDPLGGLADIEARRVRFIGDPAKRIREDYLRILRFFRFMSQLGWEEAGPEGLAACVRERAGLAQLASERIQKELARLLTGSGAPAALQAMFDYGLLTTLIAGVPYLPRLGRMIALEAELGCEPGPMRRLAALALAVPEDAARLAERLRLSNADTSRLEAMSRHRGIAAGMSEQGAKVLLYRTGAESWADMVMMAWAAAGEGAGDTAWRALYGLPDRWPVPVFPLSGADMTGIGMEPGPAIGEILRNLEAVWIESGFAASRENLLERAKQDRASSRGRNRSNGE